MYSRSKYLWKAAAAITVAIVALIAVLSGRTEDFGAIRIGVTAPLTGPVSSFGEWSRRGLELAKIEINSKGGIGGRKIELIFEDDKCQPKEAAINTNKLLNIDGVSIIFSICSAVTPSVVPLASSKALVLSPVSFSRTVVADDYDHRFTTQPSIQAEMAVLANHIRYQKKLGIISIMYVNNELGLSYKERFQEAFESLDGGVRATETFNLTDKDFKSQLIKIKRTNSQGLIIIMSGGGLGSIVNQAEDLGLSAQYFGAMIAQSQPFLDIAGKNAEGFDYTYPLKLGETEASTKYRDAYISKYNEEPEIIGTNSYDMVFLVQQILESCFENRDLECMKKAAYDIEDFDGASGVFSMQGDGMVRKPIYIKTVKNGQFVYLE